MSPCFWELLRSDEIVMEKWRERQLIATRFKVLEMYEKELMNCFISLDRGNKNKGSVHEINACQKKRRKSCEEAKIGLRVCVRESGVEGGVETTCCQRMNN